MPAVLLLLAASVPLVTASALTPPRPDEDAIGEVRRGLSENWASPRAISHYLEARRRRTQGDSQGALNELRLAVTWDEASAELRAALSTALLQAGKLSEAEREARQAIELAKTNESAAKDAEIVLARAALVRNQPERAVLALREAAEIEARLIREGPLDATPWRLLADVYAESGDPDRADSTLEDLARISPEEASAGERELGQRALAAEQPGAAEHHLQKAVALYPGDVESFRLLASAFEALHRYSEARDADLAWLRLDPDDAQALFDLGRLSLKQDDVDGAREWFRRHERASPEPSEAEVRCVFEWLEDDRMEETITAANAALRETGPDPRLSLAEGLALVTLRRFDEAVKALRPVDPNSGEAFVPARVALADALAHLERTREAEKALSSALLVHPRDVRIETAEARVLVRAGRPAEAVRRLREVLKEHDGDDTDWKRPEVLDALSSALISAGQGDEALKVLRTALSGRPRDLVLQYALGAALDRLGQADAAAAQMHALLVLAPENAEALNFLGYLWAEHGIRLDEAERLVRRALELAPRAGHMQDSLGWVLYREGDYPGALAALERALTLSGPEPTVLEHLGDVYLALGRSAEGRNALLRALSQPGDGDPAEEVRRKAALKIKLRALNSDGQTRPDSLTREGARR